MYEIREIYMNLKSDVSKDEDRRKFEEFFRCSEDIFVIRNLSDNKIQGMTFLQRRRINFAEKKFRLIYPDYGFRHPDVKGKASFARGALELGWKYFTLRENVVAYMVLYPTSYNFFKRFGFILQSLHDDRLEEDSKRLLEYIARELEGYRFDADRKIVSFRTLPEKVHLSRGLRESVHLEEYERMNPHWKEGYGVPFLVPINLYVIVRVLIFSIYWTILDLLQRSSGLSVKRV